MDVRILTEELERERRPKVADVAETRRQRVPGARVHGLRAESRDHGAGHPGRTGLPRPENGPAVFREPVAGADGAEVAAPDRAAVVAAPVYVTVPDN